MIKPTVGRVVWYWPGKSNHDGQPLAAIVTYVHSDTEINLAVFDRSGATSGRQNVLLLQDGTSASLRDEDPFAEWMPYQKQVAAGEIQPVLHATSPFRSSSDGDMAATEGST